MTEPGDPYETEGSGLGDKGGRVVELAVLVLLMSFAGICRLKPRGKLGLLGVTGLSATSMSSLDVLLVPSEKDGDGDKVGPSSCEDQDLSLDGDFEIRLLGSSLSSFRN